MNAVAVHAGAVLCVGISVIIWATWTSLFGMLTCAMLFGFFMASMGPTWSEVIVLLAGPDLSPLAIGYNLGLCGFGWIVGAPLAGKT